MKKRLQYLSAILVLLTSFGAAYIFSQHRVAGGSGESFGARWTAHQIIAPGELQEYPDVAVDSQGRAWVVWITQGDDRQEHIMLRQYDKQNAYPPIDIGLSDGLQYWPKIIASDNRIWVSWCFRQKNRTSETNRWQIAVREINPQNSELGSITIVSNSYEDAIRPSLGIDSDGFPWVAWESRVDKKLRINARAIVPNPNSFSETVEIATDGELNSRPFLSSAKEGGIYVFWDHYRNGNYSIWGRKVYHSVGNPIQISYETAVNLSPSAVTDNASGATFISYTTNSDGKGGERVGKQLRVKAIKNGKIFDLKGGQPPQIGTASNRLDAIEFPTIVMDNANRLWLFARRGQGWVIMRYENNAWYPPVDWSEGGWGGRGRDIKAAWSPDGFHIVTRRLHKLTHQLLIPPANIAKVIEIKNSEFATESTNNSQTGQIKHLNNENNLAKELIPKELVAVADLTTVAKNMQEKHIDTITEHKTINDATTKNTIQSTTTAKIDETKIEAKTGGLTQNNLETLSNEVLKNNKTTIPTQNSYKNIAVAQKKQVTSNLPQKNPLSEKPPEKESIYILADGAGKPYPEPPKGRVIRDIISKKDLLAEIKKIPGFFFGDLHTHTWISDGAGEPDEIYTRARDRYKMDFVAVTDHDLENGNRILPSEWDYLQFIADLFYQPGKFVTFVAYEWTSAPTTDRQKKGAGHKNVYFPGNEAPLFNVAAEAPNTLSLFELLKQEKAIAVPHHIGWTGTDWENHDSNIQPAVEIVSVHGAFERPGNKPILPRAELSGMFVTHGLTRGLKFGLIGGSDGHGFPWHYGVSRKEDIWRTGLTGLMASTLNRVTLFDAIKKRLSIATSGVPIAIWFTISGAVMGSEAVLDSNPELDIRIVASSDIQDIVVVRDGEDVFNFKGSGNIFERSFVDTPNPGNHFYYIRAVQKNGEVAWASPIWIDVEGRRINGPPDP